MIDVAAFVAGALENFPSGIMTLAETRKTTL